MLQPCLLLPNCQFTDFAKNDVAWYRDNLPPKHHRADRQSPLVVPSLSALLCNPFSHKAFRALSPPWHACVIVCHRVPLQASQASLCHAEYGGCFFHHGRGCALRGLPYTERCRILVRPLRVPRVAARPGAAYWENFPAKLPAKH